MKKLATFTGCAVFGGLLLLSWMSGGSEWSIPALQLFLILLASALGAGLICGAWLLAENGVPEMIDAWVYGQLARLRRWPRGRAR